MGEVGDDVRELIGGQRNVIGPFTIGKKML